MSVRRGHHAPWTPCAHHIMNPEYSRAMVLSLFTFSVTLSKSCVRNSVSLSRVASRALPPIPWRVACFDQKAQKKDTPSKKAKASPSRSTSRACPRKSTAPSSHALQRATRARCVGNAPCLTSSSRWPP